MVITGIKGLRAKHILLVSWLRLTVIQGITAVQQFLDGRIQPVKIEYLKRGPSKLPETRWGVSRKQPYCLTCFQNNKEMTVFYFDPLSRN